MYLGEFLILTENLREINFFILLFREPLVIMAPHSRPYAWVGFDANIFAKISFISKVC